MPFAWRERTDGVSEWHDVCHPRSNNDKSERDKQKTDLIDSDSQASQAFQHFMLAQPEADHAQLTRLSPLSKASFTTYLSSALVAQDLIS